MGNMTEAREVMTSNSFLPKDYKIPVAQNNYTKFEDGETVKIRILKSGMKTDCNVFWEYFDESGDKAQPVRSMVAFESTPGIKEGRKPKEMWAFKVWNYNLNQVQICSISQKTIKVAILGFIEDEDYGNPLSYDIKIRREGSGLETEYIINPAPPKEFDNEVLINGDKNIDWFEYIEGNDPFVKS